LHTAKPIIKYSHAINGNLGKFSPRKRCPRQSRENVQNATTDFKTRGIYSIQLLERPTSRSRSWDRSFVQTRANKCECENLPRNLRENPKLNLAGQREKLEGKNSNVYLRIEMCKFFPFSVP